jgi:hypothetical protein
MFPQRTHWKDLHIERGSHALNGDFDRSPKTKAPAEASALGG